MSCDERISIDIRIREVDNGLIVTVEKQDGLVFYKFYCKDISELNGEVLSKLADNFITLGEIDEKP